MTCEQCYYRGRHSRELFFVHFIENFSINCQIHHFVGELQAGQTELRQYILQQPACLDIHVQEIIVAVDCFCQRFSSHHVASVARAKDASGQCFVSNLAAGRCVDAFISDLQRVVILVKSASRAGKFDSLFGVPPVQGFPFCLSFRSQSPVPSSVPLPAQLIMAFSKFKP